MLHVFMFVTLLVLPITSTLAINFSPNVTIKSCNSRKVVIEIENAADGGLIYIQGRSTDCSRSTSSQITRHEFDFETCSIDYDSKFRLVIQRHPRYQTGSDKVIPIMCLVDTSDIYVSTVIFPEEEVIDGSVNKTIKPIVNMSFLAENESSLVQEVTLNDKVKLKLQLDKEYIGVFDIKASDCSAALIPVLENECSTDEDLFPNFMRTSKGEILSTFNAFHPTNLPGDMDIEVGFTCTVSVCKGSCDQTICGEIIGWGRRRRNADSNEKILENVTVGTKLKVKMPSHQNVGVTARHSSEYCAEKTVVSSVTGIVIVSLLFSWMVCGCALCKLRSLERKTSGSDRPKMPNAIRRLSEINVNFAKSVGRRLSTMLNIPSGYDVNQHRLGDGVLESDTPPSKRRDSVTVRNEDSQHISTLRKRFVSSATQTNESFKKGDVCSIDDTESPHLITESLMRRSSNPITSISISSASSKSKERSSNNRNIDLPSENLILTHSKAIKTTPKINRAATITGLSDNSVEGLINEPIKPMIFYEADDVTKARKPYIGVVQVRNSSEASRIKSESDIRFETVDDSMQRSDILCNDINKGSDDDDDVFKPPANLNLTREHNGIRYPFSSKMDERQIVVSQFDNLGYDTLGEVDSNLDDHEQNSKHGISMLRDKPNVVRVSVGSDVSDKIDFIDDIYEVVEIGAQVKRERKYSTHV